MKNLKLYLFVSLLGAISITSCKKDEDDSPTTPTTPETTYSTSVIKDGSGNIVETIITVEDFGKGTGTITWNRANTYVLNGMVFVNSGQTLTIEEGTVIKGQSGQGENASALIVARGAKINADGTSTNPIIFTSEADQIRRKADDSGFENSGNLTPSTNGLWGGLIILGNAVLNSSPGESAVEGIPTNESRGLYGGNNDLDNSGSLKYISIRHGGTDIGAGNEINGLTLGGVGSATEIDFVEIIANADDGVEFFGGTARIKHLISTNVGDDAIDYDEGWRGFVQFALVYQPSDRGGEHDGGTDPEDGTPYATPVFANVTSIGKGMASGKRALTFRDNAGGLYWNSIFTEWGKGVDVEDLGSGEHAMARLNAGDLQFSQNILWNCANNQLNEQIVDNNGNDLWMHANVVNNQMTDPMFSNVLYPQATEAASAIWPSGLDAWFTQTNYKGAFNPNMSDAWHESWTLTAQTVIQ